MQVVCGTGLSGTSIRDEVSKIRRRPVVIWKVNPSLLSLIQTNRLGHCTILPSHVEIGYWLPPGRILLWRRQFLQLREISIFQK